MRIKLKAYASLHRFTPDVPLGKPAVFELPADATVGVVLDSLGIPRDEARISFVNGRHQDVDHLLREDDELAIFPPIGGG